MDALHVLKELISIGALEVRSDGTIWKLARRDNQQRMAPIEPRRAEQKSKRGYLMIKMEWHGRTHLLSAHVAVYELLNGPIPQGLDVNHRDGDKTNNHPDNLEPMSRGDNHRHAYRTGLRKTSDLPAQIAAQAKALRAQGMPYSEIGVRLGVSQTTVFRATRLK